MLRSGAPLTRLKAFRDGQAAVRMALVGAALELGVLDALSDRTATTRELVDALAAHDVPMSDVALFDAYLQVLAAAGLVDARAGRSSRTTSPARRTRRSPATTWASTGTSAPSSPAVRHGGTSPSTVR